MDDEGGAEDVQRGEGAYDDEAIGEDGDNDEMYRVEEKRTWTLYPGAGILSDSIAL